MWQATWGGGVCPRAAAAVQLADPAARCCCLPHPAFSPTDNCLQCENGNGTCTGCITGMVRRGSKGERAAMPSGCKGRS